MLKKIRKFFGFKKEKHPDELGHLLYQAIQMGLSYDNLSVEYLLDQLGLTENDVVEQYQTEIIIALMFQVILVVERKYEYPLAGDVLDGMTKEFLSHTKEMGGTDENLKYMLALFQQRMKEYYEAESNTTEDGPAYWVGKKFLENLTGKEQNPIQEHDRYIDMNFNFLIGASYLTSTLVGVDSVLKEYTVKRQK